MSECLRLNSQQWILAGSDGLKLFLPRESRDRCIYFQTDWSFLPSGLDTASVPAETARLRLRLIGWVPDLGDWRDLENLYLGYHEPADGKQLEDTRGPDIWIWPPGVTEPLKFGHWATDLKFGERRGHEFEFSLTATTSSQRASKLRVELSLKEFFKQPIPPDWELPEWINEVEDELTFAGRVEFRDILCSVPINAAQPLAWAKQTARRELAVEAFGECSVHHEDCPGKFKLRDVGHSGRVVLLPMPTG